MSHSRFLKTTGRLLSGVHSLPDDCQEAAAGI